MFGNANQLPGISYAHAFRNQEREISLVSLIFPNRKEIVRPSVVDRITGKTIPFHFVVKDGDTIVTLELIRSQFANPKVTFRDNSSFTALITPGHSLSTFDGLTPDDYIVFLRDYGVEREIITGSTSDISPRDYVVLWIKDKLTSAVRVHLVNPGVAEEFEISAPNCETLVRKKNQLHNLQTIKLGDYEGVNLVIAPHSDEETIHFSVMAR